MKILIITTYYPPDTAIAAVRPYMFAKHLAERGHEVTVLRSGEFFNGVSDYFDMNIPVRVISYLGENSPAERYKRGEHTETAKSTGESRISFLPEFLRKPVAKLYHAAIRPVEFRRWLESIRERAEKQKASLDALAEEQFDVVFSTYGQLENIQAGQYAKELFHCKLVQDFRDQLAAKVFRTKREYRILKKLQDQAIEAADGVTAVSEDLMEALYQDIESCDVPCAVLYNGYQPSDTDGSAVCVPEEGTFSICYTGTLYGSLSDFAPVMQALKKLSDQGEIDLSKVRLQYAGAAFGAVQAKAVECGVPQILVNHGYVSRSEAERIQKTSDAFLVLSWNTKESRGILTGKFYEGIRAKKPIVAAVSGTEPGSELGRINRKYQYGICYEESRHEESFAELCDYLLKLYREKMQEGCIRYQMNPGLERRFRYDALSEQLEDFINQL